MDEFQVSVEIHNDVGVISWKLPAELPVMVDAISMAADDALIGHELRRLEASVLASDLDGQRALQRCGFRREGRLRDGFSSPAGEFVDVLVYARLSSDLVYGEGGTSAVLDSVLPTKRIIAHVVIRDRLGRVLLLETTYKQHWELPGGVVERDETPRQGAYREGLEELGLSLELGLPWAVDWMPHHLGWSDAIEFIFDGGILDSNRDFPAIPNPEIKQAHWVAPDDIETKVSPLSARRLSYLLKAGPGLCYLENGEPIFSEDDPASDQN